MRKYIYLMLLSGMLACQEDDLVQYTQDKDAIQFNRNYATSADFNFATASENRNNEIYYWGDSLAETQMTVILQLQGFPTPDERPYKLKTVLVEGQDSSKVAEVRFEPYYSLAPNQLVDTVVFTVLRPKARGNYTVGIALDTDGDDAFFEKGTEECAVYRLNIADRYDEPSDWRLREEWLGEFDQEKYAFMVTIGNKLFSRGDYHMWSRTDLYNAELRAALEAFNASVPEEERKQFTFPNMPKWVWWDNQTSLLGEFSIEKYEFMMEMLEKYGENLYGQQEEYQANSKLEWWNLLFREVLAEEGREDIEFPRKTERSSWWRESILGEWSLEKQEFVVVNLFPKSQNYQIGETTWDYAAPVLRRCLDRYNLANPEHPLDYEFVDEGEPAWWNTFANLFGPYSSVKRDIIVEVVLKSQMPWQYDINALITGNIAILSNLMNSILTATEEYNAAHPGQEITDFPDTPVWWNVDWLGDWSEEKQEFVEEVMATYGQSYPQNVSASWNPVLRFEAIAQKQTFDIPELNAEQIRPYYWNNFRYLGDFSVSKFVFLWMKIAPINWGSMDDYYLSGGYGYNATEEERYNTIIGWYRNEYEEFMTRYADCAEPFSFPESFPN